MNPDYDKQTNPRWPHGLDNPTQRARRIALMYREHLRTAARHLADDCDGVARAYGETWAFEREELLDPTRELTTAEAARLVNVHPDTIRKWACMDHPADAEQKLLPRFKKRGRERTYLAGQVMEAAATIRRAQHARARSLP